MVRQGIRTGPVRFRLPKDATPAEILQAVEYRDHANIALGQGRLSKSGRVSVVGALKDAKNKAARDERRRAAAAGTPYGADVAAHLPDTTWVGVADPPGWGRHTARINLVLGSQSGKYPKGYQPTMFEIEGIP